MANNVPVTAGSGTTMHTDDVAGVHYPVVKLADGTEDATTRIAAGNGTSAGALRVTLSSDSTGQVTLAAGTTLSLVSGADPLTVGNDTDVIEPAITVSTSAYTANDVVGGRLQIAAALGTLRSGVFQNLFVFFKGNFTPRLDFYLFNAQPTQNTADNGAFAWNSADDSKLIWIRSVVSADYKTIPGATTRTFASVSTVYPAVKSVGSGDLYLYIITLDAVTLSTTSDLRVGLGFARD